MPMIEANGERLFYVREGDGPAVLFIHGLGTHSGYWARQIEALRDRYTCIAFDCRGHGESSYNAPFTLPAVAADLREGLAALGVETYHIVGLAMGGPIALGINAGAPDAVRSLVLTCSFVDKREGVEERYEATEEALGRISMLDFGRQYAFERLMEATPEADYEFVAQAVAKVSPEAYLGTVRAVLMEDFTMLLDYAKAPTLVLLGDQDTVTPLPHSQAIANGIPGARLEMIPDAGHLANLDRPDLFNQLVSEFLDAQPV